MSIIRVDKNPDNPYVMLNKTALEDSNLSFKAKGIFAYLMSKPDNWKCQVKDLENNSADGRDSVRSGLRELRKHGYLIKRALRDQSGKITEWEERLFETPQEYVKEIFKEQQIKKDAINGNPVSGEKISDTINGFSVNGKSTNGKPTSGIPVPILNTNTNNIEYNNNYINTTQSSVCSDGDATELKSLIETETHLIITPNQFKKLSNWNKKRLLSAIKIFKGLDGQYFTLLEKIYKDDGNFAPSNKVSKIDNFNNFQQRQYDYDDLEKKLLEAQYKRM